jgi:hypothetical protein
MVVFPSVEVPLVEVRSMEVFPLVEVPWVVVQRMEVFPLVVAVVEDRNEYNGELLIFQAVVGMEVGIPRNQVFLPFPSYASFS